METLYTDLIFDDEIGQLLRTAKSERKTIKFSDKSGKAQKTFYYGIVNDDGIIGNAWKDTEHNVYSESVIESAIYNQVNNENGVVSVSTFESEV